jgi:cupin 2 domain-containing protein
MLVRSGNLFADAGSERREEQFLPLAETAGARIERIVSTGQASPPGFWYDQDWVEWVLLLSGAAGLLIADEPAPRILRPGDYLEIPARVRHRVAWTQRDPPTIWLAVHFAPES